MGEPVGQLHVTVVKGKTLAVRDFKSSDPYVILKLDDHQVARTKVISSCLNPVWDEEFSFPLAEPAGVLKLEVFDKDRFKSDDKMGHTHISLQPLVTCARLKQVLNVSSGETVLRVTVPDKTNCLARESSICCVDGQITQDAWLRLSDVESGDLQLKLRLVVTSPTPPPP
uniref:C2 domain-containing protein n=1 Tax=Kalanchoe fedtschenkoi TaxID=63787 RepID=A0A7N0UXV5_KALFE